MKCFFDSNVIIDALTNRIGVVEDERRLLYAATVGEMEGFMSAKQLTDIYYELRKYMPDDKKRRELISILLQGFEIIPADKSLLSAALPSNVSDYEDAFIAISAKKAGADFIITNDTKGFLQSEVEAKTPKEAIALLGIH